ncbi:hypothetical protein [Tropicibacter sp. Alg240-R139]|uniref:hypothetical protein n=1 Tax=Tropicibacter sp. Alg240-R139 TaxID=2305991 RepID=UPI0013DFA2A6|nr:hypothetical protein [Tropicibacter sp. Alg240-R139]
MTGLDGTAHALSRDCANGHCADHTTTVVVVADYHADHVPGESTDNGQHGSHDMVHDDCNPFLCNALALTSASSEAVFDQSEAALAWQISSLSTLEEPDNPYRPPNL